MEVRLAFFYLCAETCPADEWDCRWNIFNLHDCMSRIHLFENIPENEWNLNGFRTQASELRTRLEGNPFFQALPQKQRNKYINGGHAYLFPLEEIAARAGVELNTFRLLYRLFSTQVHSFPMGFYRMGDDNRGRGIHSDVEEFYINICLSVAAVLLSAAEKEMKYLFPGATKNV